MIVSGTMVISTLIKVYSSDKSVLSNKNTFTQLQKQ